MLFRSIIKTTNGGTNWLRQDNPAQGFPSLNFISFVSPTTGWVLGDNGIILKTTDGGGKTIDSPTSVKNKNNTLAKKYSLLQNYPNPFNPSTTITYNLPEEGKVTIKIYDIIGREIKTLADEVQSGGMHSVVWEGTNISGNEVASGLYFYNIRVGGTSITKKMILLK